MLTTFSGCSKTTAPTVRSEVCSSRHQSIVLVKKDFDNIAQINKNEHHQETMKKLVKNIVINEKEFK
jgi:nitrate reductase beta subunit